MSAIALSLAWCSGLPFSPLQFGNAVLWLRSDLGVTNVGGTCSVWADQSGHANNVSSPVTFRPAISASGGPNSVPALVFNGTTTYLQGLWTENQPIERYVVAKSTAVTGSICDGTTGNNGRIFVTSSTSFAAYSGAQLTDATYTINAWHVHGALFAGASASVLFRDGAQVAGPGSLGVSALGGITLGNYGDKASDPFAGSIVEVVDFSSALTSAQRAALNAYFVARYGAGI